MTDTTITTRGFVFDENSRQQFAGNAAYLKAVNYAREQENCVHSDALLAQKLFEALSEFDPLIAAASLEDLAEEALAVAEGLRFGAEAQYTDGFPVAAPVEEPKKK